MLVSVTARIDNPVFPRHVHQKRPEHEVRLGVHHHEVLAVLECRPAILAPREDGARRFEEGVRRFALRQKIAILADGHLPSLDCCVHHRKVGHDPVVPFEELRTLDRFINLDVTECYAVESWRDVSLVEEALAGGASADDGNLDTLVQCPEPIQHREIEPLR